MLPLVVFVTVEGTIGKVIGPSRRIDRNTGKANGVKVINGYYVLNKHVLKSITFFCNECILMYM